MRNELLYIKIEQNIQLTNKKVYLEDIAKLYSADNKMVSTLNKMVLMQIKADTTTKYVVSIMKVIEFISKEYPAVEIINLGEQDFIIEFLVTKKKTKAQEYIKAALVALVVFFGSAFTIMTFNTDVSVSDVFDLVYELVTGDPKTSGSVLEISYSIGLPIGIIVFFNHFSRFKLHNDPTPLQIEMRTYEEDTNKTLILNASREGKTLDAN